MSPERPIAVYSTLPISSYRQDDQQAAEDKEQDFSLKLIVIENKPKPINTGLLFIKAPETWLDINST